MPLTSWQITQGERMNKRGASSVAEHPAVDGKTWGSIPQRPLLKEI